VKVLLDECVDWRLLREVIGHEVKTARQMGWLTIKNGELLALAAKEFEVFVTVDRNLSFQQNLLVFDIAVIVLCGSSNRLADLQPLVPELSCSHPSSQARCCYVHRRLTGRSRGRRKKRAAPLNLSVNRADGVGVRFGISSQKGTAP
jgi:hypothetical protein